jgi:hypothetical protein
MPRATIVTRNQPITVECPECNGARFVTEVDPFSVMMSEGPTFTIEVPCVTCARSGRVTATPATVAAIVGQVVEDIDRAAFFGDVATIHECGKWLIHESQFKGAGVIEPNIWAAAIDQARGAYACVVAGAKFVGRAGDRAAFTGGRRAA